MDVQEIQLDYEKKISDLEYNIMQHHNATDLEKIKKKLEHANTLYAKFQDTVFEHELHQQKMEYRPCCSRY